MSSGSCGLTRRLPDGGDGGGRLFALEEQYAPNADMEVGIRDAFAQQAFPERRDEHQASVRNRGDRNQE